MSEFITNVHIASKRFYSGDASGEKAMTHVLPENKVYTCKVDYPFEKGFTFNIKVGEKPLTLRGFVARLRNAYMKHYEKIHNEKVDDGYWHSLGDLFLEKLIVNDNKIELWIGS